MDNALRRLPRALGIAAVVAVIALMVAVSAWAASGGVYSSGGSGQAPSSAPSSFQPVQEQADPATPAHRDCPHHDGSGSGSGSGQSAPSASPSSAPDV
jgi:hypothetical protein